MFEATPEACDAPLLGDDAVSADKVVAIVNSLVGGISYSNKAWELDGVPHKTIKITAGGRAAAVVAAASAIFMDILRFCKINNISPNKVNFCWRVQPQFLDGESAGSFMIRTRYSMWPVKDD